jgi:diacylglycerol kinase family enzyme
MRTILVHNTGAGDGHYDKDALLALIRSHGHDVAYFAADGDWKPAARPPVELVVAAGGDGTVEDVARHLAGGSIPIGLLPLGTANNVAGALGIARQPIPDLVSGWASAERRPFDAGRATAGGRTFRFIESLGVGLVAESIAEITRGGAGYVDTLDEADERMEAAIVVLRETLRTLEPARVTLVIDGRKLEGDYLMAEVMNFGWAGPNLRLVPDAAHSDGLFDIVLADVSHRTQLMDDLPFFRLRSREPFPLPVARGRHVILNAGDRRFHLDDQLHTCEGDLELTVEPEAVSFLV